MDLFHWFRRRRASTAADTPGNPTLTGNASETLHEVRTDIDQVHGRLAIIDITLKKHDDQLAEHQACLQGYAERLQTLEQKVASPAAPSALIRPPIQPGPEDGAYLYPPAQRSAPARTFDIDRFSEQEKRILAVFFQNKGVRMSYEDVAQTLGKSACTIKNQMNQIRQKADLFDRTVGDQSRSFFKLKDDLRVEKYLKVGQPIERPLSIAAPDQSPVSPTRPSGDRPLVNSQT